ncbi:MAG: HAMP domain-containing histidine kinase [Oscillospiraceae bacterium]|nr:HAMP domain-containing histidine kinase [Oscillospiraceae bacterium]
MKTLKQSFAAKLIAVILLCAAALTCAASGAVSLALYESGAYTMGYDAAARQMLSGLGTNMSAAALENWKNDAYEGSARPVNFRCVILAADGEELYSDYKGEDTLWDEIVLIPPEYSSWSEQRRLYPDGTVENMNEEAGDEELWMTEDEEYLPVPTGDPPEVTPTPRPTEAPKAAAEAVVKTVYLTQEYRTGEIYEFDTPEERNAWVKENTRRVHGYILRDIAEGDQVWEELHFFEKAYGLRSILPAIAAVSLLLGILLFLFLLAAAGWHRGEEGVRESFADRIPFDLFTLLIAGAEAIVFSGIFGPGWNFDAVGVTAISVLLLVAGLIFLLWCMSLAVRVKCGTVWKNNVISGVWRWLVRLVRGGGSLLLRALKALPMMGRWAAILGGLALIDFLLTAMTDGGSAWLLFFLRLFVLCPAALYLVWQLRKLRLAAHELAQGDLNTTVDTKGMFLELKEHAQDLNAIRDGVSAAVEERLKSERFRTELITNVSHDIKTPLTSIVSYVDLLEKEELGNETAKGYVEVLSRQSARLKKLIEDLVDASKASTGNLTVNWERLELGVLLDQAAGEYAERMEKAGLELVCGKPDHAVAVMGDGRHMWRIFDNLMGNAVKYAQPGTRVYVDLAEKAGKAEITFRNISRERLNTSGEELAERFVRGDASRSTEGSGLGLSIAMSLAQLQKGEMQITVDGDLFKVTLSFDEVL